MTNGSIFINLQHPLRNILRIWVSTTNLAEKLRQTIWKFNLQFNETWWDQIWPHEKHRLHWHGNIIHNINQTLFIFWATIKKSSSYSEQPTTYIMKWKLLKSTEKYSYASQLTKNVSSLNLEGDTLFQIENFRMPLYPHFSYP